MAEKIIPKRRQLENNRDPSVTIKPFQQHIN